jgi:hypothetical protein
MVDADAKAGDISLEIRVVLAEIVQETRQPGRPAYADPASEPAGAFSNRLQMVG